MGSELSLPDLYTVTTSSVKKSVSYAGLIIFAVVALIVLFYLVPEFTRTWRDVTVQTINSSSVFIPHVTVTVPKGSKVMVPAYLPGSTEATFTILTLLYWVVDLLSNPITLLVIVFISALLYYVIYVTERG